MNNSKIINFNEGIMIYLQKIQMKKFNMILMLIHNEINIENPYIPPLFEDISWYMKLTKRVFFEYKPASQKKLNFLNVYEQMNAFQDILELGFIELSKSKRTQLATHLSEILTKTNEIINKKGFYELQNVYRFEKEFNRIIKLNIRYNILKEIIYMVNKKCLRFQIMDIQKTDETFKKL